MIRRFYPALCLFACLFHPLRSQLVISEFLASNSTILPDELGKPEDWIEIQNKGAAAVSLSGCFLTDSSADLRKWAFPAWTLNAGGRMVVFASGRDQRPVQKTAGVDNAGVLASPRLATNFKLGAGAGGFLALTKDAGGLATTVLSQYAGYPKQFADFSYGKGVAPGAPLFAVEQPGIMKYIVPTAAMASVTDWNTLAYNDSSWTASAFTSVGFDSDASGATSFRPFFKVDLGDPAIPATAATNPMYTKSSTIYTRYAFTVADKNSLSGLTLKLKYEDGFVAWLNGVEIARGNFTGAAAYNSTTTARIESLAIVDDVIDVTAAGLPALQSGANVLAIMGINAAAGSNDFLLAPSLLGVPATSSDIFLMPTPGAANTGSATPASLAFSVPSGLFTGTLSISITGQQPGQTVRYTTNGTIPTLGNGTTYVAGTPIIISANTTLKARIFFENTAGPMADAHYTLRGTAAAYGITPATFSSSLPILVIDSESTTALTDTLPKAARVTLYDRNPGTQRASLTDVPAFSSRAVVDLRGQSSAGLAKKGYGIEFRDVVELDKNIPVLGMPSDSDWVIYASYQYDTDFMRNVLMYEFYRRTGRWAPRTRFVEVFMNPAGTSVDAADYLGVYVLMEKIKIDKNRINLSEITQLDNTGDALTGGYLFAHDKEGSSIERLQTTLANWNDSAQYFVVKTPSAPPSPLPTPPTVPDFANPPDNSITPQQQTYLTNLIAEVDTALGASNFTNPTTGKHYRDYLARDSFIDHHMFNAFAKNVDGLRISTYFQKDRLGKIQLSSIWDFDRSMDCDTDARDDNPAFWNSDDAASSDFFSRDGRTAEGWFNRLQQDSDYMQDWVDRYDRWRAAGVIDSAAMNTFLDQKSAELTTLDNGGTDSPIARNFFRWPRTIRSTAVTQANAASVIFTAAGTASELGRQKSWIQQRIAFMDTFVLAKPASSVASGLITPTTDILLSSADSSGATFYYTVDGTDPRATGGGVAPAASAYGSSIRLTTSGFVTARLRKTGLSPLTKHTDWSAPIQVYYTVGATPASPADLRVSELMYHPADPTAAEITAGFLDSDQFEYVELLNAGAGTINLYGASFTAGVDFNFSNALKPALLQMAPGDRILVVKNLAAFTFRYGATAAARVIGEFAGNDNLNNAGETITITAANLSTILSFTYADTAPWPVEADGLGASLLLSNRAAGADPADPANWKAAAVGGTPGTGEITAGFSNAASSNLVFSGQLVPEALPAGITRAYTKISGPAWLSVSSSGVLSGTPLPANIGSNAFAIAVTENGNTFSQSLSLVVNATPAFASNPINLNATEDAAFAGQLTASDADAGASLTFAKVTGPSWLTVSTTGALSGTPTNSEVGPNTFSVSVSDGIAPAVNATLNVTVANINDAPTFASNPINLNAAGGSPFTGQLAASDADAGTVLTFSKESGPAWLAVSPSGALSGTPSNGEAGLNVFTVSVTDAGSPGLGGGGALSATATLNVMVAASGPSFSAFASTNFTAEEQANPLVSGPAADPDGDGIPNLLEYALALDPRAAAADGLPKPVLLDVSSESYITLVYTRRKGATDITFTPEFSATPGDAGFTASPVVQVSLVDNGNGTETVTVRDAAPVSAQSPRFARIRVTRN